MEFGASLCLRRGTVLVRDTMTFVEGSVGGLAGDGKVSDGCGGDSETGGKSPPIHVTRLWPPTYAIGRRGSMAVALQERPRQSLLPYSLSSSCRLAYRPPHKHLTSTTNSNKYHQSILY